MKKKIIALLITTALTANLVTGCGMGKTENDRNSDEVKTEELNETEGMVELDTEQVNESEGMAELDTEQINESEGMAELDTEQVNESEGMADAGATDAVVAFFDELYQGVPQDMLPASIATTEIPLDDMETVTYHTGLEDVSEIDAIYLSESMIGSVAYSAMYIKTKEGTDAEQLRQTLMDKVNPSKWICVTAEKQIAALFDNDIFFVMAAADTADEVYNQAKAVAESKNMTITESIEKTNAQ